MRGLFTLDKKLIVLYHLFSMASPVLIAEGNTSTMVSKIDNKELAERLGDYSAANNITTIDLFGPKTYTVKIKEDILTHVATQYGLNNYVINLKGE